WARPDGAGAGPCVAGKPADREINCGPMTGPAMSLRVTAVVAALSLSGCELGYYGHLAHGEYEMLAGRDPIAQVLDDPKRDATLKQRLRLARDAREYAVRQLGL